MEAIRLADGKIFATFLDTFSNALLRKYFFTNEVGTLDNNVVVRLGLKGLV